MKDLSTVKNIVLFHNCEFQDEFNDILKYLDFKSLFEAQPGKTKDSIRAFLDVGLVPNEHRKMDWACDEIYGFGQCVIPNKWQSEAGFDYLDA